MSDIIQTNFAHNDLLNAKAELPSNTLLLEASLLGGGIKDGFVSRRNQALEHPGLTTLEFIGTAAIGAGLACAHRAGGRWGIAAEIAAKGFTCLAIGDAARRLAPTAYAMSDTYVNPKNYSDNRALVAKNLGTACFDYPLMAAGGYLGAKGIELAPRTFSALSSRFSSQVELPAASGNPFFDPKGGTFGNSEIFNEPISYFPHEISRSPASLKPPMEIPNLREVLIENRRDLAVMQSTGASSITQWTFETRASTPAVERTFDTNSKFVRDFIDAINNHTHNRH